MTALPITQPPIIMPPLASPPAVSIEPTGVQAADGEILAITLEAGALTARILTLGATLDGLVAPDREGCPGDVVLGYDRLADRVADRGYRGVTVGPYANRIAGGRFTLDGVEHELTHNDGANCLHGGSAGFDLRNWTLVATHAGDEGASVTLGLDHADGAGGFPGAIAAQVTYALDCAGQLTITMRARSTAPGVIAMTNHALFNLAADGRSAMGHRLTLGAAAYTPVDAALIPTGELRPVEGTVFDFRKGRTLDSGVRDGTDAQIALGRGYDHNFVLDKGVTQAPEWAARLEDPCSGRVLDVLTTEPGVQLYTTNWLDGAWPGKHATIHRAGDGVALEPQKFPDTPNRPAFGSARIDADTPYVHVMAYRLSVAP